MTSRRSASPASRRLPHFTGSAWQGGPAYPDGKLGWAQLTATGGHPGNDLAHAAVRRWTAPRDMRIRMQSTLIHEPNRRRRRPRLPRQQPLRLAETGRRPPRPVLSSTSPRSMFKPARRSTSSPTSAKTLSYNQFLWQATIAADDESGVEFHSKSDFENQGQTRSRRGSNSPRCCSRRMNLSLSIRGHAMFLNRRDMLRRAGAGLGMLGLSSLLAEQELLAGPQEKGPLAPKQPHFVPRAKRVVHFFCNGGPSHVDTFDPKPALAKYAGQPLPATAADGAEDGGGVSLAVQVSEVWRERSGNQRDIRQNRSARGQPWPWSARCSPMCRTTSHR
jgi:hypothetical protein